MLEDAKKALDEFDAWNRPDAAEAVAEALRAVLADVPAMQSTAWAEGHAATDEHGPGDCLCPNPYSAEWVTAPDGEEFRVGQCQGHAACSVERHEHGCYADDGANCDHPDDHPKSTE